MRECCNRSISGSSRGTRRNRRNADDCCGNRLEANEDAGTFVLTKCFSWWRPLPSGMGILALSADERVRDVRVSEDTLTVDLMDGRTISVPLVWYPRLLSGTPKQRSRWKVCAAGYGIHWPDLDEDLSTDGLLRGAPAPVSSARRRTNRSKRQPKARRG